MYFCPYSQLVLEQVLFVFIIIQKKKSFKKMKTPNYNELEQKIADLEYERNYYKLIADNTYDRETFIDKHGEVKYLNKAFERITGYSPDDELSGLLSKKKLVHTDDWEAVWQALKRSIAGEEVTDLEFRIIRKDKQIRYINLCAAPVYVNGELLGVRTSARDISHQKDFFVKDITYIKQTEQLLKEQNEQYATLNEEYKLTIEDLSKAKDEARQSAAILQIPFY